MRYMRRPRARRAPGQWKDENQPLEGLDIPVIYDLTVYEDDNEGVEDTGLVHPDGDPIFRCSRGPLGFLELGEDT